MEEKTTTQYERLKKRYFKTTNLKLSLNSLSPRQLLEFVEINNNEATLKRAMQATGGFADFRQHYAYRRIIDHIIQHPTLLTELKENPNREVTLYLIGKEAFTADELKKIFAKYPKDNTVKKRIIASPQMETENDFLLEVIKKQRSIHTIAQNLPRTISEEIKTILLEYAEKGVKRAANRKTKLRVLEDYLKLPTSSDPNTIYYTDDVANLEEITRIVKRLNPDYAQQSIFETFKQYHKYYFENQNKQQKAYKERQYYYNQNPAEYKKIHNINQRYKVTAKNLNGEPTYAEEFRYYELQQIDPCFMAALYEYRKDLVLNYFTDVPWMAQQVIDNKLTNEELEQIPMTAIPNLLTRVQTLLQDEEEENDDN